MQFRFGYDTFSDTRVSVLDIPQNAYPEPSCEETDAQEEISVKTETKSKTKNQETESENTERRRKDDRNGSLCSL